MNIWCSSPNSTCQMLRFDSVTQSILQSVVLVFHILLCTLYAGKDVFCVSMNRIFMQSWCQIIWLKCNELKTSEKPNSRFFYSEFFFSHWVWIWNSWKFRMLYLKFKFNFHLSSVVVASSGDVSVKYSKFILRYEVIEHFFRPNNWLYKFRIMI